MQVMVKITADMTRQNVGQRINAVQGDGNTRSAEITLLSGGQPWTPPDGVEAAIAYQHTGHGARGLYNLLADGSSAISISGNVATIILAPQMLTVSGTVQASLVFNDAQLNRLTTFPFSVSVVSNPAAGTQKVEDYLRLQWLEDKLDEYVKKITEGLTPGGAVSSVNGKTGAVVLSANDVHALPDTTEIPVVPKKVSAFENDAGYLTEHQDISGKVDKVAGMGLSTHDYDDAAKAKVDAIPEDPKYTDTVYDDTEVKQGLNQIKADKLDKPEMPPDAAGKVLRVLSVNEDGTFSCEWADAPSGGEIWEKITEITTTEDGNLIIDRDLNGNAFNLKKLLCLLENHAPSDGTSGGSTVRIYVDSSCYSNNVAYICTQQTGTPAGKIFYTRFIAEMVGDKAILQNLFVTSNAGANMYINPPTSYYSYQSTTYMNKKIDCVVFRAASGIALGKDSKVEIWGVRV